MSRAGPVSRAGVSLRDLGTFAKLNKNQLREYMRTRPARLAEIPASRCLTGLRFFHVIALKGENGQQRGFNWLETCVLDSMKLT